MKDEFSIPKVALGEVCDFVRGVSFDGNDAIDVSKEGYVPILRAGNIGDELYIHDDLVWVPEKRVSKEQYFQVGDIAICMASGSPAVLGKTAQLKENFIGSVGAFCGIVRPTKADPNYIAYWLKSPTFMAWRNSQANGVNIQNLRPNEVREIEIPLPRLTEQKRIASLLARADRLRTLRRTAHDLGESLLQSVFLEMFGHVRVNDKKWELAKFEDVCPSRLGKMLDDKKQTGKHKRPYLRNFNVRWYELDLSDIAEMDFDEKDRKEFRLEFGDVLICEGGEVGRAAIWRNEIEECYFQKALHRARPNPKFTNPEYIVHLLWWMAQSGGLVDATSQVTFAHLTGEKLKELVIPVPPLSLQEEFAGVVARVELLRGRMSEAGRQVEGLFESLLAEAFDGHA